MACSDWEDAMAVGINIFQMLRQREHAWRDQVFRGVTALQRDVRKSAESVRISRQQ
jgi:hypothetical protein